VVATVGPVIEDYTSEGTVRNYISTIFAKIQVTDRTQAAIVAIRSELIDLEQYE
jgi:DNA-binding NarL/FixJ family response regulator